jgi:hypothetical protein
LGQSFPPASRSVAASVCVLKLSYKTEKLLYGDFMLHVAGKTQGLQMWLLFFVHYYVITIQDCI